jgi:hypothetical protein
MYVYKNFFSFLISVKWENEKFYFTDLKSSKK